MHLCPTCQASLETEDAAHECIAPRAEVETTPAEPDAPHRPSRPSRPPRASEPPNVLALEDERVDLDTLMALPVDRTLYRALPPPPPPPRPAAATERSSIGPVVGDLSPDADLDFDDRPTPPTPMPAFRAAPERRDVERSERQPSDTASHRARRDERRAQGRRGMVGMSVAIVTLSIGGLAIVLKPHPRQENDLRKDLEPAAQLVSTLVPIATALSDAPPEPPPPVATAQRMPPELLPMPRVAGSSRGLPKAATTAPPAASAGPQAEAEGAPASVADPPKADASAATTAEAAPLGPFDPNAARAAMQAPKGAAFGCFASATEGGVAQLTVVFLPTGQVSSAAVSGPPFGGTAVGSCISSKFQGVTIAPFDGPPVTVAMSLSAPAPVEVQAPPPDARPSAPVAPEAP